MNLQDRGRFEGLLGGASPTPIWDTVVAETREFVIAPTKGSIIPGWLLVVPRAATLNMATLVQHERCPANIAEWACDTLGIAPTDQIWFEHGASARGSAVGCGVDHAHMHLLLAPPFALDEFRGRVTQMAEVHWRQVLTPNAYDSLTGTQSYYAFGDHEKAWVAEGINLGSQFFRRVVANLVGRSDQWDYHTHDGSEYVAETLRRLSRIAAAEAA